MITKRKYPWIGRQDWSNIVFLHWPVERKYIRPFVPKPLQLDLFNGMAWVSVVFFQASGTSGRMVPKSIALPTFNQLNVRTYVYHEKNAERGVYFLDVYIDDLPFSFIGKNLFHLPFQQADFRHDKRKMEMIQQNDTVFSCFIESEEKLARDDLASFLTERYCIWNLKHERVIKIPILHKRWKLQRAKVHAVEHQLFPYFRDKVDSKELVCHYSPFQHSVVFPYEKIKNR